MLTRTLFLSGIAGLSACAPEQPTRPDPFVPDGEIVPADTVCTDDPERCLFACEDLCDGVKGALYEIDCSDFGVYGGPYAVPPVLGDCVVVHRGAVVSFHCGAG